MAEVAVALPPTEPAEAPAPGAPEVASVDSPESEGYSFDQFQLLDGTVIKLSDEGKLKEIGEVSGEELVDYLKLASDFFYMSDEQKRIVKSYIKLIEQQKLGSTIEEQKRARKIKRNELRVKGIYEAAKRSTHEKLRELGVDSVEQYFEFYSVLKNRNFEVAVKIADQAYERMNELLDSSQYSWVRQCQRDWEEHKNDTDRLAMHDEIIRELTEGIDPKRVMYIFGGPPGAGKSILMDDLAHYKRNGFDTVIVDADIARFLLWEKLEERGLLVDSFPLEYEDNQFFVQALHEEASEITKKLLEYAIKKGLPIIWQGVFKDGKQDVVVEQNRYTGDREKDYQFFINHINVLLHESFRRSIVGRKRGTPLYYLLKSAETFRKLGDVQKLNAQQVDVYENSGEGGVKRSITVGDQGKVHPIQQKLYESLSRDYDYSQLLDLIEELWQDW